MLYPCKWQESFQCWCSISSMNTFHEHICNYFLYKNLPIDQTYPVAQTDFNLLSYHRTGINNNYVLRSCTMLHRLQTLFCIWLFLPINCRILLTVFLQHIYRVYNGVTSLSEHQFASYESLWVTWCLAALPRSSDLTLWSWWSERKLRSLRRGGLCC